MRRQYNPTANVSRLAPVRPVETRQVNPDSLTKAREKLDAVLGDSRVWSGDKDAIAAGRMLRAVLGVSWQPKTLHSYRTKYWQQGLHWFPAPGPKGLVTFDILKVVEWWYQQQEGGK